MAKVFRLHEGADGTGWFLSQSLTPAQLTTIKTDGKEVATSIPSPFARIDLVKSAFRWVTGNGIKGSTAHHKLVSEALDVAQLFYLSRKYKSKVEIVAYNPLERFKTLVEQSEITKHARLAETLKLYWDQDSVGKDRFGNLVLYNFEHVKRLYLILNKETRQVIGGTSPATLFFAAPDAGLVTSSLKIKSSDHDFFDDEYASLAEREPTFVKYIFALSKQPGFPVYFPEFYSYLEKVRLNNQLSRELVAVVTNLGAGAINDYDHCPVLENVNDICEILDIPLGMQKEESPEEEGGINESSDFTIMSDFPVKGKKPLVLPYGRFAQKWTYTTSDIFWNENYSVPYRNDKTPEASKLPFQEDRYNWLSIGNFLEDKIIELPYSLNGSKFNLCGATRYLLPVTPLFLSYFKAENIDRYLKLQELSGGGVEAVLEIPVKKGLIHFKKIYSQPEKLRMEAHLAIVPFIRVEKYNLNYNIGIIDDKRDNQPDFLVECFESGNKINTDTPVYRNQSKVQKSYYFKTRGKFNILRLISGYTGGCIIPRWKSNEGGYNAINFAIDFGTTNTHIEYKSGNLDSCVFDNSQNQPIWQSLLDYDDPLVRNEYIADDRMFEREIMPYVLPSGNSDLVHFPLRTALVFNRNLEPNTKLQPFRHSNYYMFFEKMHVPLYLDIRTQLKWSNYSDPKDESLVESYIEFLVLIVFYKTLILGGDPEQTTITWFYPVSMDEYELGVFFRTWKKVYQSIFGTEPTEKKMNGIPESIAPYLYYKSSVIGQSLSVDIGGGSTDIALFDEDTAKAKIISSFKFAGNAIFGDGFPTSEYKNNSDRNGFVRSFAGLAREAVKGDSFMQPILENILNKTKDSTDFSSLLFALEANSHSTFSYTRLLESNKRMKLPIFIFYGALAYYSANLLKRSGSDLPKFILLSGTASKTASILDTSNKFTNLSGLFRFIFERVAKEEVPFLTIKLSQIPKEITCKGALKVGIQDSITNNTIKFWIGGSGDRVWSSALDKVKDISLTPKYGEIDAGVRKLIESSIQEFYAILDDYTASINLEGAFNIELQAYQVFRELRDANIQEYLIRGLKAFYKKDEKHIEETLFFYPLIGILNKLSFELTENQA
jgi:hypothetical protein